MLHLQGAAHCWTLGIYQCPIYCVLHSACWVLGIYQCPKQEILIFLELFMLEELGEASQPVSRMKMGSADEADRDHALRSFPTPSRGQKPRMQKP